jgi:hypothetical protein
MSYFSERLRTSNSESDSSSNYGSSLNEDRDDESSVVSYYNVTDDPHFWGSFMEVYFHTVQYSAAIHFYHAWCQLFAHLDRF